MSSTGPSGHRPIWITAARDDARHETDLAWAIIKAFASSGAEEKPGKIVSNAFAVAYLFRLKSNAMAEAAFKSDEAESDKRRTERAAADKEAKR